MAGPSVVALGLLVSLYSSNAALAQAVNLGGVNNILADGRTQTNISVNGNTTSITTDTVSQGTGFNSFSDFQQAAGTRVDLYVPDGAGNLVNIVRNGPVVIDGILNSYKDGAIGGNVFFSSPGGFIVGQNGVVNVGALTVNTPTAEFLSHVIRPDGSINDTVAARLMRGEVPISPDGIIAIAGTINAQGGVVLQGSSVSISGQVLSRNGYQFDQRTLFQSSVNTAGLVEGTAMVMRDGVVSIVASGSARVSGTIDVGSDTGQAGHISVRAGGDVTLEDSAHLAADGAGEGGGGLVEVIAGDTLYAWDDALISAQALGSGDGGFVELSGKTVVLGGIKADLGATAGRTGTLLIDPWNLYIGGAPSQSGTGGDVTVPDSVMGNIVVNADIRLQADNSITVAAGGIIDTTSTTGASGNITLEAPLITIANNAILRAEGIGGAAGNILLDARAETGGLAGFLIGGSTTAGIVIGDGAILSGRDISLLAAAEAGAGGLPVSVLNAEATIAIGAANITASGAFTAQAVAQASARTSDTNFVPSPLGVVTADVVASVTVGGNASIAAASASLDASATADIEIVTQSVVPDSSPADGAIAVSVIDSRAIVEIGGTADLDIAGTLALNADNTVTTVVKATPNSAAFGASVAVSVIDTLTSATIGGNATIAAGALDVAATSTTSAIVTASAASGGGSETAPEPGSQTAGYLDEYGKYASTGDPDTGGEGTAVSVVGGLAVSDLTATTTAAIGANADVTVTGLADISAISSNSAEIVADGSTVEAATGVAAAVGVNLAKVSSTALVEKLSAGSLTLAAGTPSGGAGNFFSTTATSGAGSTNVGIAGSFAVNLIDTASLAGIGPDGAVSLTGADRAVALTAANVTKSTAKALPDGVAGGSGATLGIGASIALNIAANRAIAEIGTDADVTNASSVSLTAEGAFTAETEATAGSAGGVSITPALALSLINNTTIARLASGNALDTAGAVILSAQQRASTTTTASGEAAGDKAAIGAALALALVNDNVTATTLRAIDAGGAVSLAAQGASFSVLSAKASATGGKSEDASGGDEDGVDKMVDANLASARTKQTEAGVGDDEQRAATADGVADKDSRSASTSEGGVSVAAAVGVNVQNAHVSATVVDGVSVSSGGTLSILTAGNTDGRVTSDGSAVAAAGTSGAQVGIGAAVSVNVVSSVNRALLGAGTHDLGGLRIAALKTDVATPANGARADVYLASATSGAGGSSVGIAGSLALNIIDTESTALLATGAAVALTGGDVHIEADNRTGITAEALPHDGGASGGSVGVGASAAINIIANRALAQIANNAALTGAGDVTLSANGAFTITTKAEAGSKGGVSITPALALSLINNTTSARLGTGSALVASGTVGLSATQQASTTSTASGAAAGENVAIGAAVAVALVNDTVSATTLRDIGAGGAVSLEARGASFSILTATASAAGGKAAKADGGAEGGESVDEQVDGQLDFGNQRQTEAGVGDADQRAATDTGVADKNSRSASTSEGGVSVAAAVGVNVQNANVSASVANGLAITAGGTLSILTAGNTDGRVTSDGSAVAAAGTSGAQVGIGAAVSVNVVSSINRALLGSGTHTLGGLRIAALKTDVATPANGARADVYLASATSGAGGSSVGIAGSLALNIIDTESAALVATGAAVTLTGGGDVDIEADNRTGVTADALPKDAGVSGGTVGVGASAAINIIANRAQAWIADGATLAGARDVTLSANGVFTVATKAEAGSKGGVSITPALALSLINNATSARLGTGSTLATTGAVGLSATQQASTTSTASGVAAGGNVAVGAAVAVALVNDTVTATTLRGIDAGGDISFAANSSSSGTLEAKAGAAGAAGANADGNAANGKTVDDGVTDQLSFGSGRQQTAGVGDSSQQGQTSAGVANQDGRSAKSEEGKVSVAAAVAVNVVESSATALVPGSVVVLAGGRLTVASTNTTGGTATADASATGSEVGIAAVAAVNAITKTNTASLVGNGHSANGITVSALQFGGPGAPVADVLSARASSGAGGSNIGIAGALGLNIVNATTTAEITGNVNAGTATSSITADNRAEITAEAKPNETTTTGETVGVGASVALNLITTTTTAALRDGAALAAGTGLAVSANSALSTTTKAAAGGSGGVAVDAVVALALIDDTTTARIGAGAALSMGAGAVSVSATSGGTHTAEAVGETKGGKVGVGASAALILGNGTSASGQVLSNTSVTSASLARDVTAGSLSLSAASNRVYLAEASATAGGGKTSQNNADAPPPGDASSSNSLKKTEDYQKGTDGGSKVQVAAAVGIAAAQDVVTARLEGGVNVTTTGAVTITAGNVTDMVTMGTGAAVDAQSNVGVGIGVALGIVNNATEASISDASTVNAGTGNVAVRVTTSENATQERVMAAAVAGAASRGVSVAGALAVGISTSSARAFIGDGVTVSTSGGVAVTVDNTSQLAAKALAGAYSSGGSAGVGASAATAVSEHELIAAIGAGTSVAGGDVTVSAVNHEINIPPSFPIDFNNFDLKALSDEFKALGDTLMQKPLLGRTNYYTEAIGGAAAPSGVAVAGSFAVMVFDDTVSASIGRSLTGGSTATTTVASTGNVTIDARNDIAAKAVSGGIAVGNSVGVGVSSSVIVSSGTTRALLAGNAIVTGSASFAGKASASQDIWALGLAAGAASTAGIAGVATVITSENTVEALVEDTARVTTSGAATLAASNEFDTISVATGVGAGGTAGIGGAASAVVVENVTRAALGNAARLDASGATLIDALSRVDALTLAAAGAGGGTAGVAAGAAVYVLDATTEALVGDGAEIGQVAATPGALTVSATDDNTLITVSGALGGGGTVGAGAGAAVGVIGNTVTAAIGNTAKVNASNVTLDAGSALTAHTIAIAAGVGGTAGLAGAASVYAVDNATIANIGSGAIVLAGGNVAVMADEAVDIAFIAGSLAGSGAASIGASASVAVVNSTTRASIASSAQVTALANGAALTYVTGYTPGLNAFTDPDSAISAPNLSTDGDGGEFDPDTGPDGEVLTAAEARRQGLRLLLLERDAAPTTASARGVIVNATGTTAVRSLAVGGAVSGGVSVSISANVPVITSTVLATIDSNARINMLPGAASANQSVVAAAASDVYRIGVAGSVAGGTAGIGGGVETAIINLTTRASIGAGATVEAARDVIVSARARQDLAGAAAAGAVGVGAAIAGGVSVFSLDSGTEAEIGAGATVTADGNVAVLAEDVTRSAMVAGSVAIDFAGGGMAGSIGVTMLTKRTSASIANNATVTALGLYDTMTVRSGDSFSGTRSARGVVVHANSNESLFTLGISGAGGAFVAFAGAASVQLLDIATTASIGNNANINTLTPASAHAGQDVVVIARNSTSVAAVDGGIAVSLGAGLAGAVDVGILRNTTAASIGNGATVQAQNRVDVAGLQNVDIDSLVVSGAVGVLGVGVAAGVSVYSIGDGIALDGEDTEETSNNIDGTGTYVQGQLDDDTVSRIFASSDDDRVKDISSQVQTARDTLDVETALSPAPLSIPAGTSATIGAASINAGGAVSVRARDTVGTYTITGAAGGGLVGIGAGVGMVTVESTNTAQITGTSITGGALTLDANSSHTLRAGSAAGGVALAVAAQAAIAMLTDNSVTRATMSGATIATPGAVAINAQGRRIGDAQAMGAAIGGGGAVGVSLAMVNLGGSVEARLTGTTIGTSASRAGSVSVGALAENLAIAETGAASGGLGIAAAGSLADADVTTTVTTTLDQATIFATGLVKADSEARGRALADARGIALAGLVSVGGSLANARVGNSANTTILQSALTGGTVALGARTGLFNAVPVPAPIFSVPGNSRNAFDQAATAYASGSSGAFVGITATSAQATNSAAANIAVTGGTISSAGGVTAAAGTTTSQNATASGLAVGVVAVGANDARARSTATTQALFTNVIVTSGGLAVTATGTDSNFANATSGSGGVVAGAAANATTGSTSTTRALVSATGAGLGRVQAPAGSVTIAALHTTNFGGKVDSTQASAVGMSSANIAHTVNSTVDAGLSDSMQVVAANLTISARNLTHNFFIGGPAYDLLSGSRPSYNSDSAGWNVDSGSGGLVNVPAGSSNATVTHTTTARVGAGASVNLLAPISGVSRFSLEAYNEAIVQQRARLDSGGAIALADTEANVLVNASAAATLGELAEIVVDVGDIEIAAWGQADLEARAVSTTYGLAGAPSGQAHITYNSTNTVDIARNMRLEATNGIDPTDGSMPTNGTVSAGAGAGLDGREAAFRFRTTVDLFNNTAIPIDSKPDARVVSNNQSNLFIRAATQPHPDPVAAYGISAAGDITLRAMGGNTTASAVGIGKNIYLEALSKAASAISNLFGGGDITFEVRAGSTTLNNLGTATIDGLVRTGLQRHKTLTISYVDVDCDVLVFSCVAAPVDGEIGYAISGPVDVGTAILDRLSELRTLLSQYNDDPVAQGAYRNEINFLERKLASLGLGHYDAGGNFVPGAYAGPSPRDALLAEAAGFQSAMVAGQLDMATAAGAVVDPKARILVEDGTGFSEWGDGLVEIFATTEDPTLRFGNSVTEARDLIERYSNYANYTSPTIPNPLPPPAPATVPNPDYEPDIVTWLNEARDLVAPTETAANQVRTIVGQLDAAQNTVNQLVLDIQGLQFDLADAQLNAPGSAAGIMGDIASKQSQLNTALAGIATLNTQLQTQANTVSSNTATILSNLNSARSALDPGSSGNDASITSQLTAVSGTPTSNGPLTRLGIAINGTTQTDPDDGATITIPGTAGIANAIQTYVGNAAAAIGTLSGSGAGSLSAYLDQIGGESANYVLKMQEAATAPNTTGVPQAFVVDVADVAARLGNVSIVADRLVGSGSLRAPGDAAITITNNTANTLRLGNILIPTYDAGNLRFNGVLVNSNADINRINPAGTAASFNDANIITGATSSRPLVSIVSNYNPESNVYYNPSSPLTQLNTQRIAPDIILKQGSVISNLTGAVEITSNAGNIYINGEILAGSVSILAKNGDFVSSYVNGFNHIGGDPASFNIPTNRGEAGRGIIANGAVSIAARYININSTIQSGIANWTATLDANPVLTTSDPSSIGLTQLDINNAIATYQAAMDTAYTTPGNAPSPLISLPNGLTLNMTPAGMDATALRNAVVDYLTKVRATPTGNQLPDPLYTVSGQTINIKDFLSPSTQGRIEFTITQAEAYLANNASADGVYATVARPGDNIGVAYDAKNARYVIDGTSVRGGYIQLYGQIMNTGGNAGQLNVLDGFGTININNTSDIPVVLATLNTGDDPTGTGRGVQGVIEITDVIGVNTSTPSAPRVDVRFTRYTRDYVPGQATGSITATSQLGHIDPVTGNIVFDSAETSATGGDRTAAYNPTANQRYVWTTGRYVDHTTNFKVKKTQLFGSSSLTISSSTHFDSVDGPHILNTYRLLDGTYVTTEETANGQTAIIQTNQGIVLVPTYVRTPNSALAGTEYTYSTDAYLNHNPPPTKTGEKRNCNWWTLCIASKVTYSYSLNQKYTVITTNSLKADHPIAVNFIGNNTGAITVASASNVVLTGSINNASGNVAIGSTNGSIIQGNLNAQITANSINLSAGGSVGGVTNTYDPAAPANAAIAVHLNGDTGALTANAANGGVAIIARGDLAINQVTAAGNVTVPNHGVVNLTAAGSITAAHGGALIEAPRVVLTALNGAIGSTADGQLLRVNTGFTTDPALRPFGDPATDPDLNPYYGLTATAAGDIGITSAAWAGNAEGTLLVDRVSSLGGDVRLAATGFVLDNNPLETIDSRTYGELIDYWESLGLLAHDNDGGETGVDGAVNVQKQADAIAGFERARVQAYKQYWQIRQSQPDGGTQYDPDFTVAVQPGSPEHAALSRQFGDAIRADNPAFTDQQVADAVAQRIADYETAQTTLYHELDIQVGGLTPIYDNTYTYTASAEEQAALTRGATWTERQLAFSLSAGALKTVTSTNPVVKDPNVSGRTITIEAGRGVGETIGAGTADIGVSIPANIAPRDLTIAQKVALAAAERSDLVLNIGPVVLPADATPEQVAAYNTAVAMGLDLPGSSTRIPLGTDEGDLSPLLQAALNAAALGLIPASDMTIVVLAKRPLNFDTPEAINVTVTASPDGTTTDLGTAHLASRNNALLGMISVPGETRIKVLGTIINASGGSAVNTGNLVLEAAQGGIGAGLNPLTSTSYPPLQLSLRPDATLTARAQAGVNIEFAGNALIDTVYSPQDVRLAASAGSILNANNDLLINILGTNVVLEASGTIGTGLHALNVGNNLGGGITASATGLINLFGSAGNQFVIAQATSATGTIKLAAALEGVIDGAVTAPGRIDLAAGERMVISSRGVVRSTAGMIDVDAKALKMINGAAMSTDIGRIAIRTDNDALVTGIVSGASDGPDGAAVTILAGGRVFGGTAPANRVDITALATGASVSITAGLGIGDKTQANDRWHDGGGFAAGSADLVTDAANPLRILTATMAFQAATGDIRAHALAPAVTVTALAGTGSIGLTADGSFTSPLLQAGKGNVSVEAEDDIVLASVLAGTDADATSGAIDVISRSGRIDVATAQSGGSQAYEAEGDIAFAQLTTSGLPADIGDVTLLSHAGAILGGDIDANGSIFLTGNGVTFGTIVSGVNSAITSDGDILGDAQIAGDTVTDIATGNIRIGLVRAPRMNFDAGGSLVLPDLRVAESVVLRGGVLDVGITHEPTGPGPLLVTMTGSGGGVGTYANVRADAPQGLTIPQLRFFESEIETTARIVEIEDAYVPGAMRLQTPLQTILAENRSPTPQHGNNMQMYQPGFAFQLSLRDYRSFTNAYVVIYDVTAQVTDILDGLGYDGASLVRDTIRVMYRGDGPETGIVPLFYPSEDIDLEFRFEDEEYFVVIDGVVYPILTITDAPSVQLSQLSQ